MNMQAMVLERYSKGAKARESELCCPVSYDPELLKRLPQEIIDKDYGCGDPSRYVRSAPPTRPKRATACSPRSSGGRGSSALHGPGSHRRPAPQPLARARS